MFKHNWTLINSHCILLILVIGCSSGDGEYRELDDNDNVTNTDLPEHHDHAAGPHGGQILEFGDYHGEIAFANGIISVYVLDNNAENPVAVGNGSTIIKLEMGDKTEEVVLTASPQPGEADGTTSLFVSSEDAVPEAVQDIEDILGTVVLTVGEEKFTTEVTHDHDH